MLAGRKYTLGPIYVPRHLISCIRSRHPARYPLLETFARPFAHLILILIFTNVGCEGKNGRKDECGAYACVKREGEGEWSEGGIESEDQEWLDGERIESERESEIE